MAGLFEAEALYKSSRAERRCSKCGETKALTEFAIKNKKTGLRSVWCRACRRAYGRDHYRKNRPAYLKRNNDRRKIERPKVKAQIDAYLREHPCVDCGRTDITMLEFDHRDPTQKDWPVGELARSAEWPRVLSEIQKCDVRCANCHRRRTAEQFGWSRHVGVVLTNGVRPGGAGRYASLSAPRQEPLFSAEPDGSRRCSRCRLLKSIYEFALRDIEHGLRDYYCRPCRQAYRRGHYDRNRADYIARAMSEMRMKREDALLLVHAYLREHPCADCGATDIVTLEFDHRDPTTKITEVAKMLGRRSWPVIAAEIAKCDVVCANCHRKRTARQQGWKVRLGERAAAYGKMEALAGVA